MSTYNLRFEKAERPDDGERFFVVSLVEYDSQGSCVIGDFVITADDIKWLLEGGEDK